MRTNYTRDYCFNRATFIRTEKPVTGLVRRMIEGQLQLSHVHSNVETSVPAWQRNKGAMASIEPRSFKRGNPQKIVETTYAGLTLQLSHVHSNVETMQSP